MARVIQKFGGTSLATVEKIFNAAHRVEEAINNGDQVAVVVSAMAGTTSRLVSLTREISALHDAREYDVVVSAGEQITAGLMALAIQSLGIPARSWLAWQLPINTNGDHGKAHIQSIETGEIINRMCRGEVAVVPGFQGITRRERVATLGRGGSDASAVALAAALEADLCNIYTCLLYTSDAADE